MSYKNTNAERSTITRDVEFLDDHTGNIYKSIAAISMRADQISSEVKEELIAKLAEFASTTDNLEEIFENREQIEISKFYEQLPKPAMIAIQEFIENKMYLKDPNGADVATK
ncbi:RNA polymerase Rpb6 [Putridiphycobacter roseus]|uniref:RNA polymerase Rpb6 n=1 Tax=Putridiphycobacter roseus TaxID=2219161 RepID=A0A2W1NA73_9FLAO|nr:RNA polymerase Rpb6 [Putridiphycobacter roseus]